MRRFTLSLAAASLLFTCNGFAAGSQLTAGIGMATYNYDTGDNPGNTLKWPSYTYSILDLGYSLSLSDFYLNFNAMFGMNEASGDIEDRDYSTTVPSKFKRNQYSANIGYRITPRFSLFTGINYAQSTNKYGFSSSTYTDNIKETGYHFGVAGAPLYFKGVGALTAKLGYSFKNTFKVDNYKADGAGLVFGIGWNGIISREWSYYLNLDGYAYSYKDDHDYKTKSTLATLKAGIGYRF